MSWARVPLAGALAAVALLAMAVLAPTSAARGWLIGFVACATPVIGALALTLIGELTGGRWSVRTKVIASAAPALLVLWAPLGLLLDRLYPWADGVQGPGHAAGYLSTGFYLARSISALVAWGALGWVLAHRRPRRLVLALALLVHAVLVVVMGVDWVLSLRPGWMSSDFGMNFAAQQIAAGAAVALLASGRNTAEDEVRDLAALITAGVLGVAYLAFMDYLIVWYGNLPERVGWYLARERDGRAWLAVGAFVVGAVSPPLILAAPRLPVRVKSGAAAVFALAGLLAFQLYLLAPLLGWGTLAATALSILVQGAVLTEGSRRLPASFASRTLAHG